MATTSSSSSFTYEYDVFINFRGKDTRLGFTRHLYKALCAKKVKAFMDDQELEKGAVIAPALDKAIQDSRIALVIFSKNYAESAYCLEELAKIMECSNDKGMLVCPVFYQVAPAEVRHHQKGDYAEALTRHETRNYGRRKLERWKLALETASALSGWHFRHDGETYEDELIEEITQYITEKISSLRDGDKNQEIKSIPKTSNVKPNIHSTSNPLNFIRTSDGQFHPPAQQPKPQSSRSKNRGGENLPDKRVDYNKGEENSNVKQNTHSGSNGSYVILTSDNQFHYIDRDSQQPNKRADHNEPISSSCEVIGNIGGAGHSQGPYPQQCMDCMINQQMMHGQPPNMAVDYIYLPPYTYPPFPPPGPFH